MSVTGFTLISGIKIYKYTLHEIIANNQSIFKEKLNIDKEKLDKIICHDSHVIDSMCVIYDTDLDNFNRLHGYYTDDDTNEKTEYTIVKVPSCHKEQNIRQDQYVIGICHHVQSSLRGQYDTNPFNVNISDQTKNQITELFGEKLNTYVVMDRCECCF